MMNGTAIEDSGEFWLPDDFLPDDFFIDKNVGDGPNPSSPVQSVTGTESQIEDDYISALVHQISRSFLEDCSHKGFSAAIARDNPKPSVTGTSPKSTLCGIGSWSFSSNGSPEGPSRVPSPPSTPFPPHRDAALDLLYAAAGRVARLGLQDPDSHRRGFLAQNQKMGLQSNHALIQQQLQAARFYEMKRQQLMRARNSGPRNGYGDEMGPLGLPNSAWPPLQKQQQRRRESGMRTAFLNGGRRESRGTGVFLPRPVGAPNEPPRKKPEAIMGRGNAVPVQGKRNPECPQPAVVSGHEVRLPREWAY